MKSKRYVYLLTNVSAARVGKSLRPFKALTVAVATTFVAILLRILYLYFRVFRFY